MDVDLNDLGILSKRIVENCGIQCIPCTLVLLSFCSFVAEPKAKDMSTFQNVRKRLNGCRPFAWYLKRFKAVYEDAGLIPAEIFMIREELLMGRGPGGQGARGPGGQCLG